MSAPVEVAGHRLRVGAATDVGAVRDHNEDALLAEDTVLVVADGMGGHAAGEVASRIAVETFGELVGHTDRTAEEVVDRIGRAHDTIVGSAREHPEQRGMGTTTTGLVLVTEDDEPVWLAFNVGDSRLYTLRAGELSQVSVDHSEVQELVDAGVITPDEAAVHPARNIVTRSLGAPTHHPDVWLLPVTPGETLLLCSDGLTNELTDGQVRDILLGHPDPAEAAEELVRSAVTAGGRDNVSVVVAVIDDEATGAPGS